MRGKITMFSEGMRIWFLTDENMDKRYFRVGDIVDTRDTFVIGDEIEFTPAVGAIGLYATNVVKQGRRSSLETIAPVHSQPQNLMAEIAEWKTEAKLEDTHRYFYHTSDVDRIENGARCYVIGRKGTGKTAISEFLCGQQRPGKFAEKLTFKNFPFNDLYSLDNQRYSAPNQYITLWKYVIYASIAQMMGTNEALPPSFRATLSNLFPTNNKETLHGGLPGGPAEILSSVSWEQALNSAKLTQNQIVPVGLSGSKRSRS